MTKKELITGDIIVNRAGFLGVVIKEEATIIFQTIGGMDLEELDENLTVDSKENDFDIMEVYRGVTFLDVEIGEDMPIYQRDENWSRPSRKERILKVKEMDKDNKKKLPITMV